MSTAVGDRRMRSPAAATVGIRGEPSFAKLRPGPGQAPEAVRAHQRARLHAALIELVAERGYAALTVRALTRTSGISTRAFYANFANVEDLFISTHRSITEQVARQLAEALEAAPAADALRRSVGALIAWTAHNPKSAHLAMAERYCAGPTVLAQTRQSIDQVLEAVKPRAPRGSLLVAGLAEGIEYVLRTWVLGTEAPRLADLESELTGWLASVCLRPQVQPGWPPRPSGGVPLEKRRAPVDDPGLSALLRLDGDRGRILGAVARLSTTEGFATLTPPRVRRQAGVSRRRFESLFQSLDECQVEAAELLARAAALRSAEAVGSDGSLRKPVPVELVRYFCAQVMRSPALARVGFLDAFATGSTGLRVHDRLIATGARFLQSIAAPDVSSTPVATEASLAAGWRILQAEIEETSTVAGAPTTHLLARLLPSPRRRER